MKLGLVVNDVATEQANYTTIRLSRRALADGHEVFLFPLDAFTLRPSNELSAEAVAPEQGIYDSDEALLEAVQSDEAPRRQINLVDLDVLMLRSDPADEVSRRPWAPTSMLLFAQLATRSGTLVLNDPWHLTHAANKTYFQHFPREVRPATVITRDADEIRAFIKEHDDQGVIKPLQGSGGQGVFVVRPEDKPNLSQMIEAVVRDGYALVQEYLPKAADGDHRLLLLNGKPLEVGGHIACFRRYNPSDDARSNISAGGEVELVDVDEAALDLARIVAPKLIEDGMYFVGLDVVGDKLLEINVDTPGGINMIEDLTGEDFCAAILADLERKVWMQEQYEGRLSNTFLATL